MPARKLTAHAVEKPWGRPTLGDDFARFENGAPIGEIWFDQPASAELLVKYLFTSERLSIQVHPDDAAAQAAGYPRGKDEAWYILDAAPDSTIALGPLQRLSAEELRSAAFDGSIVDLLDWRPVRPGDFIYSPAGTIHAIGAGLTLIEVQQNLDLTYRLYDYGRPRELHLEDGAAVSTLAPFVPPPAPARPGLLAAGPKFVVERLSGTERVVETETTALLIPVTGTGTVDGETFGPAECWSLTGRSTVTVPQGSTALLAYPDAASR
ncbi:class I mannose-6-phosphate isomerase [Sphingomonas sp. ID1715]|uniref:class I mannose-6-phosphate isomerase n=1 Tax=Sphingomonas sp. ID1715 TaxID=1656898 RepID=UPI001488D424|nr:class I mannose-6-phosphate isomerase [Sphingomonas sp. ID1715]NNM75619.1 class I mannose-6-phosphate isomerase [Sphingomonas sp. ID1715]